MRIPRALFYFLSLTWGLPLTLIGIFAAIILRLRGFRSRPWGYCRFIEFGQNWGGCSLGIFVLVNKDPSLHILKHEHGHAIQNCFFGPFMLLLVAFPSFVRYHYRNYKKKRSPHSIKKPYDAIWFEGQATLLGEKFYSSEVSSGRCPYPEKNSFEAL